MRVCPAILFCVMAFVPSIAVTSIPSSQRFGEWDVSGITSESGIGDNDASVGMGQQHGDVTLSARWQQGGSIYVSATANKCRGDDDDFNAGYHIPVSKWLNNKRATRSRVAEDYRTWLRQIKFSCDKRHPVEHFKLEHFDTAFEAFTAWIFE